MNKTWAAANSPEIIDYLDRLLHPEDEALTHARVTAEHEKVPAIQVGALDARHLEVLARATGATKIVEIGTLFGYSGIALARALPPGGRLWSCEFDPRHAAIAEKNFRHAGVADSVEILVGPARDTLPRIESQGPFDLVFIDADKVSYPEYLDWSYRNLRMGGTLLADNTLAWGSVADVLPPLDEPSDHWKSVRGIQEFNRRLAEHPGFRCSLLPTGEGLFMAVKTSR